MIVTLDTNVLVYATGPAEDPKAVRARDIVVRGMRHASLVLLLQTLAEYSYVAIRKGGISAARVQATVEAWRQALPIEAARYEDLPEALHVIARHRLSFWDALLWSTARRIGARYLLTEDFQDGRKLEGVHFINPYAAANDGLIEAVLSP